MGRTINAHAEVIVLGCGGVGSAAAYHLAKRGIQVIALDRFAGPHDHGSSHGETRIIRQAYFEHPNYVPLLFRAYELWHELEAHCHRQLFYPVGLLQVGSEEGPVLSGLRASSQQHNLPLTELTAKQIEARYPGVSVPAGMSGLLEEAAGYLRVEDCVRAHQQAAVAAGTTMQTDFSVTAWESLPQHIAVHTTRGTFTCNKLVITAGPWAPQLLQSLNVPLSVRRKHVYWFHSSTTGVYSASQQFPTFLFDLPEGCFYGFPVIDELGLKTAEHSRGESVEDPLVDDCQSDAEDLQRVEQFLSQCMPQVSHEIVQQSVCYYTMTPDEHFLIDRHPQDSRVCFAAGLSGHGFKFTSVLGEILADLALNQGTLLPAQFLEAKRFSN